MRIVVLGGGFGGVTTARHLERLLRGIADVEITLVSRENFFVLTPLLFEACSGRLELRHCAQPIRAALRRTRFVEATIEGVDVQRQIVRAVTREGATYELPYDHLVVALGASTNEQLIPGSSNAFTFKTMADALVLRNHLIEQFERADAASDSTTRRSCLTVVVIGGGLVGVELLGELTAFADDVLRFYPRIRRDEIRFQLFEAGPRILPEIDERLAAVAIGVLQRRGADVRVATPVRSIEAGRLHLANDDHRGGHHRAGRRHRSERHRERNSRRARSAWPNRRRRDDAEPQPSDRCGRWVTARRSLGRTAARIQRSRSTPCARRDSSRATSDASSTGAPQRRSSFNRSAPWRRSGTRVLLRASSASPSPGSPPGGSAGRTTCSRCRAGIGGFASSSTGRWRCSSGRTSPKSSCASSGSR